MVVGNIPIMDSSCYSSRIYDFLDADFRSKQIVLIMRGNPKYKVGDRVRFEFNGELVDGKVYIVDTFGTWEDPSDVSYDVMSDQECLYKHIREDYIL